MCTQYVHTHTHMTCTILFIIYYILLFYSHTLPTSSVAMIPDPGTRRTSPSTCTTCTLALSYCTVDIYTYVCTRTPVVSNCCFNFK